MAKKGKTLDGTIIDCMDGVLAEWFPGDTWMSWRSILKSAFALPMTDEELDFFHQVAEREPPQQRVRELWVVGGRRGGKDSIASLIITYIAAMFDGKRRTIGGVTLPALRRGERGTIFCLARDRDQAAIALDYVKGFFVGNEAVPELRQMVVKEVRDGIQLATASTSSSVLMTSAASVAAPCCVPCWTKLPSTKTRLRQHPISSCSIRSSPA